MKIVEFFKSLVLPTKMARYRNMSVLISLLIFVTATYLLSIPFGSALEKSAYALKENYNFLAFQEVDDYADSDNKAILQEIVDLECAVNDKGLLECTGLSGKVNREYNIEYEKEGIKKKLNIFFDFYDSEKEEEPAYDLKTAFSIENDKYKYVENEEQYFLVFTNSLIYYQSHQLEMGNEEKDMVKTHNEETLVLFGVPLDYQTYYPDFNLKLEDANTFGDYVIEKILVGFSTYYRSTAFIQTFMVSFIFPLLMVLIFWLFFKRNGQLKRFKEYFNIAAISSIIPLIIVFAIAWLYPIVLNWYIFVFSLFYLFVLFKINNTPTEHPQQ
ncbi:MAG: hypothetical protein PHX62_08195 [Bacilli bacterium]|nr:hypothetical protein [Bacilli bacterium]